MNPEAKDTHTSARRPVEDSLLFQGLSQTATRLHVTGSYRLAFLCPFEWLLSATPYLTDSQALCVGSSLQLGGPCLFESLLEKPRRAGLYVCMYPHAFSGQEDAQLTAAWPKRFLS